MSSSPVRVIDRSTAWSYLVVNAAVWPGAGSVLAGRRSGYMQATLSLLGMLLSLYFVWGTFSEWWVQREVVLPAARVLLAGLCGVGLFAMAWLWALCTSLSVLRSAPRERR